MKRAPKIDICNLSRSVHPARPNTYTPNHLMIVQQSSDFEAQIANQPKKCKPPTQFNPKSAEALMQQSKATARFHNISP